MCEIKRMENALTYELLKLLMLFSTYRVSVNLGGIRKRIHFKSLYPR